MAQGQAEVIAWVGSNIVPHEAALRAWLRAAGQSDEEINDIVHDAYVSIARLDSVAHIRSGKNYLFQAAKNLVLMRVRRERIVPIDGLTEIESLHVSDDEPSPERRVSARLELERVRRLIAGLPDRCREIFELRRIEGVPQREIAERLGLPEHTVEAQAIRGLKLILKAIKGEEAAAEARFASSREDASGVTRNG